MSASGLDEIEPFFDAFDTRVEAVNPAIDSRETFFEMRDPHLQILDLFNHAIDFLFHPSQARLDLLENRKNDVRSFGHDNFIDVRDMFFKREPIV
jgi:hypothetical protein